MTNITDVKELTHFIGGKMISGESGRFPEVFNPATGEVIAKVPLASSNEVKDAIKKQKLPFLHGVISCG